MLNEPVASRFSVCEVKTGTVMNIRCTHCNEQLPITKPLRISTLVAVMNAFGSEHLHEDVITPQANV